MEIKVIAKKFADLGAKMMPPTREEALRQTQCMLVEMSASQTAEFFAERAGATKQVDLARLLLQVKAREPLAGYELPR